MCLERGNYICRFAGTQVLLNEFLKKKLSVYYLQYRTSRNRNFSEYLILENSKLKQGQPYAVVRYADDFVVFSKSSEEY